MLAFMGIQIFFIQPQSNLERLKLVVVCILFKKLEKSTEYKGQNERL